MPEEAPAQNAASKPNGVDVETLALKVYKLMLEDIRLQKARGQATRGSGSKQR
jgi:hypothetical protein